MLNEVLAGGLFMISLSSFSKKEKKRMSKESMRSNDDRTLLSKEDNGKFNNHTKN